MLTNSESGLVAQVDSKPIVDRPAQVDSNAALNLFAQVLGLTALLLPAAGVLIRWLAYTLDRSIPEPLLLAASAPLPELAATALASLVAPALTFVIAVTFLLPGQWGRRIATGLKTPLGGIPLPGIALLCVLAAAAFILTIPAPRGLILFGSAISGAVLAVGVSRAQYFGGGPVLASATALLAAAIVSGGLALELPAAWYTFEDQYPLGAGPFIRMATIVDGLVLLDCNTRIVTLVPSGRVVSIELRPLLYPPDPTLWETLSQGSPQHFGLRPTCP